MKIAATRPRQNVPSSPKETDIALNPRHVIQKTQVAQPMVVHAFDAEAQATLNGAADGKIAEDVFAAQAEEAHRNLLPVADASFPVWSLPVAFSEALLVRIDA